MKSQQDRIELVTRLVSAVVVVLWLAVDETDVVLATHQNDRRVGAKPPDLVVPEKAEFSSKTLSFGHGN